MLFGERWISARTSVSYTSLWTRMTVLLTTSGVLNSQERANLRKYLSSGLGVGPTVLRPVLARINPIRPSRTNPSLVAPLRINYVFFIRYLRIVVPNGLA
jgi:hypothetical protein